MSLLYNKEGLDEIKFKGRLLEIFFRPMSLGKKTKYFEYCKRSPGTRMILENRLDKKILIIREYRYDTQVYDYRLPGGKVFETIDEFEQYEKQNLDIKNKCTKSVIHEVEEECGIKAIKPKIIKISSCGATIIWDLYYYYSSTFKELPSKSLKEGEDIENLWFSYEEIIKLCINNEIKEDRTVAVLLEFLLSKIIEKNPYEFYKNIVDIK